MTGGGTAGAKVQAPLDLCLLGTPRVRVDGQPLQVDTRKAVALLALLALDGPQQREALAAMLWPESDTARARGALRRTLSVLSKALGGRWLETGRTTVSLDAEGGDCDVVAVRALCGQVDAHHATDTPLCPECVARLRQAVDLHRGDLLEGFGLRDSPEFDAWRAERGEHLRRERCRALDRLSRAEVDAGELDGALGHVESWLAIDPLNEQVHGKLMLLHAWRGERTEAIRRYRTCVATLDRELGVAPLPRTTALYHAVVEDRVQPPPTREDRGASQVREPRDAPETPAEPVSDEPAPWPLVGRAEVLGELERWHDAPRAGLHLISGEAGIGKTRLADALVERLRDSGARIAEARCYPGEVSLAFAPVVELLRAAIADTPVRVLEALPERTLAEVGRLVPDLLEAVGRDLPTPPALDSPGGQALLFESVWEVLDACLGGEPRGLVVVDDLHAVDHASLELLGYGLRRLGERRLDVVACVRREDAPDDVLIVLDALAASIDARTVALDRLDADAVLDLIQAVLPDADPAGLAPRLLRESEGLPLLVIEYLRLLSDGAAEPGEPDGWLLPHGARELARSRLATVSETGRQLASAAAAIGRSFALETLRHASGRTDEELVEGIEELTARRLVRELAADGDALRYDFVHDKLRAAIYEDTSLARRRLLHGRVTDALARGLRQGEPVAAAAIGEHARLAGRDDEAAAWFLGAGEHARSLFANSEAVAHLERALALGHPESWWLRATIGDLQVLLGDYTAAAAALEAAAAQATEDDELARTEHRLGELALRRGEHDSAASHLSAAAALTAGADPGLEARIAADRGLLRLRTGDLDAATAHAEEAADLADAADDTEARAQALNLLGVIARHRGDYDSARYELGRSAALAAELDNPAAHVAALNNLALATAAAGDLDAAIEVQRRAVAAGQRRGDRHREAALRNNLADLLHQSGQEEAALAMLEQAVALFATVDAQARPSPEIWKLVDW